MSDVNSLLVASVLNNFQVVLNGGSAIGVKWGWSYTVYTLGDNIIDPETQKSLGRLEIVKGDVRVYHVQENMCIASSDDPEKIRKFMNNSGVVSALQLASGGPSSLASPKVGDKARRSG